MKKRSSRPASRDNEYGQFLQSLTLIGLALKSCSASVDRTSYAKLREKGNRPARTIKEKYTLTDTGANFFEAEGQFDVVISGDKLTALHLECIFETHFHFEPPLKKECAQRFTDTELRLVLLPYARQFVSSVTAQMQIPLLIPLATKG